MALHCTKFLNAITKGELTKAKNKGTLRHVSSLSRAFRLRNVLKAQDVMCYESAAQVRCRAD